MAYVRNTVEKYPQSVKSLKAIVSIASVKKINLKIPGREFSPHY